MQAFFTGNDYRGYRGAFCVPWTYNTHTFKRRTSTSRNLFTYIPNTHIICTPFQNIMLMLPSAFHSKCSSNCSNVYYSLRKCLSKLVQRIAIWSRYLYSEPSHTFANMPILCVPQSFQGIQGNVRFLIPPQKNCEFHAG